MDNEESSSKTSESQNSEEPAAAEVSFDISKISLPKAEPKLLKSNALTSTLAPSPKGVENAKKRLRAFSIQKKTPLAPVKVAKSLNVGNTTVVIGKLTSVKVTPKMTPKVEDPEQKKLPKPPKPGTNKKLFQDSYTDLQKRTLTEIEDMKRKMELVELGIPLGLICPSSTSDKAMPTKAMPPIKSFLDPAKVDEIIREAKKARAEGKQFKFDYQKLLPDYDNPFQRKREATSQEKEKKPDESEYRTQIKSDRDKRNSDRYDSRRHFDYRREDRDKYRDVKKGHKERSDRIRDKEYKKDRDVKKDKEENKNTAEKEASETNVNLSDYLVCDSWSLDNDDKTNSPKVQENITKDSKPPEESKLSKDHIKQDKESVAKKDEEKPVNIIKAKHIKIGKLKPVNDSFKYEIDPDDEEVLDIFDEDSDLEKYAKVMSKKDLLYDSLVQMNMLDYDQDTNKDNAADTMSDDVFLESVIDEIKQEEMNDDSQDNQDKGLVEYDMSPPRPESPKKEIRHSATPELDDRMRDLQSSQRSDYSDSYRSTESGYNTTESGYKSTDSYKEKKRSERRRMSVDKELDASSSKLSKTTADSLEMWSFVLKICQPLLFRHDKNKCYRETRTTPKIWYAANPKLCSCVKDRCVVYDELELYKMGFVDRVYGCDQIPEEPFPIARSWYPRVDQCLCENNTVQVSMDNDWEVEDAQETHKQKDERRSLTPQRNEEVYLDREYQRFMEAVWPEVTDAKPDTSGSTTPVKQDATKKKKLEEDKDVDDKKKAKKIKLSSEGWSQESDLEDETEKSRKAKEKLRKRKHSSSSLTSSEEDAKKRRKSKKKEIKKAKSKATKQRRLGKKYLKKLKDKQKKRKKNIKAEESDDGGESEMKSKKAKKRKMQKLKKKNAKKRKKVSSSSSSSTSSSSSPETSSESDSEPERKKKSKKKSRDSKKKNKRKRSSSESQTETLFDINILNNIKTERLTDDEKCQRSFSPRKQKHREIINVKELQNDFVGNNIHIKKEIEEEEQKEIPVVDDEKEKVEVEIEDHLKDETEPELKTETSVAENKTEINEEETIVEIKVPQESPTHMEPIEVTAIPFPEEKENSKPVLEETVPQLSQIEVKIPVEEANLPEQRYNIETTISQSDHYGKTMEHMEQEKDIYEEHMDEHKDNFEQANYDLYEQMAMAYQCDVASHESQMPESTETSQRIETVVRSRMRGEITCDWRAGDSADSPASHAPQRPSRWGMKPGEVNIVLTGGNTEQFPIESVVEPVYQIQSLAKRTDNSASGYDEAYLDMYGASDRLQYGDCFATSSADAEELPSDKQAVEDDVQHVAQHVITLDERISQALQTTVLGEVAKDTEESDADKYNPEKGILIATSLCMNEVSRGAKRVSFADGYKPGQDSDVEEPPKKRKKVRRVGCAWPCPASHPDHVQLWDALPPPPPPPGSPPPTHRPRTHHFDHSLFPGAFMPPEPPPGLLTLTSSIVV